MAETSKRLEAIGYPIADTGLTKTEQVTRRVDVDDLVPLSLVLGVTPNALLMPPVAHLGTGERHQVTPGLSATAEQMWQWAQGESPLRVPGGESWPGHGGHPDLEFSLRCRPYLAALHAPGPGGPRAPLMNALGDAVLAALRSGARAVDVRRIVELTIALPVVMSRDEIDRWLKDGTRPGAER